MCRHSPWLTRKVSGWIASPCRPTLTAGSAWLADDAPLLAASTSSMSDTASPSWHRVLARNDGDRPLHAQVAVNQAQIGIGARLVEAERPCVPGGAERSEVRRVVILGRVV